MFLDEDSPAEEHLAEYVRNMDATPEEDVIHGGPFQIPACVSIPKGTKMTDQERAIIQEHQYEEQ